VCITGRDPETLASTADALGARDRTMTVRGSTDDEDHRAEAVALVVERFGSLDLLVNNAATNVQFGPLIDADLSRITKTISANLLAVIGWCQQAWRASMQANGGAILNVSSVGGLRPGKYLGAYNISKAGLIHLTRQLALELGPTARVNALAVGMVPTDMAAALYEGDVSAILAEQPLGRFGTVEDIAAAAGFLLSDQSQWITGETLVIDGGGSSLGGVTEVVTNQLPPATAGS
jgi:3-oxoacyl-[acyl-carrier protein] reductase